MTKCPYVPPHPWKVDFPHLMLRAKAVNHKQGRSRTRDKVLTSTDVVGTLAGIPVVSEIVNGANRSRPIRRLMDRFMGVHPDAILPEYQSRTLRQRVRRRARLNLEPVPTEQTRGRVVLFTSCYGNRNEPEIGEDLIAVFEHNGIPVQLIDQERCCGMPKLELGDLDTVEKYKDFNAPRLAQWVDEGWDVVAPVPSCVLMFKQELPLLFPEDPQVKRIKAAIFDPFEYLMLRHKAGRLKTDFKHALGKIAYHVPCHQRVQNIGLKTRDMLELVPDTQIEVIERCSGHDGTYAVKSECHETSMKIGKPVVSRVEKANADHYVSDCPMAAHQIENGLGRSQKPDNPLSLLKLAYGI
jgi:Fe-S oxidoreductase